MKGRMVIEGNSMQVRGEPEGQLVTDEVSTYLRAAGRSEMKCELSLVHTFWLGVCGVPFKLLYML